MSLSGRAHRYCDRYCCIGDCIGAADVASATLNVMIVAVELSAAPIAELSFDTVLSSVVGCAEVGAELNATEFSAVALVL